MSTTNSDTIIKKSLSGVKWTVILSIIALPISYAITVLLGRISPEALGLYGSVNIFISFVTTFILFGGNNLIIKYIPEIKRENTLAFIKSYIFIVSFIAIFIIGLILFYPQLLEFLFGDTFPISLLPILVIFVPIIIFYSIFDYVLNGLMEIRLSAIVKKIVLYGNFLIFSILILLNRNFFEANLWGIIFGASFILYVISALLVFIFTLKTIRYKLFNDGIFFQDLSKKSHFDFGNVNFLEKLTILLKNNYALIKMKFCYPNFYLPENFWRFALFVHLSTIVVFIYDKIDQLLIINFFGLQEFGLYYPALQTALLIRFIPTLLGIVLLPTFSNLLASNETTFIQKTYHEIVKYNTLIIVPLSLFCVYFSKQIMGLFGEAYVQSHLVLVVLALCFMVSSLGGVNSSIILAKGQAGVLLLNSVILILFQVIVTYILISPLGIIGFAIGRGSGMIIGHIGILLITYKLTDLNLKIPREFIVSILMAIITGFVYFFFNPSNIFVLGILFITSLFLFLYLSSYSLKDLQYIIHRLGGSL